MGILRSRLGCGPGVTSCLRGIRKVVELVEALRNEAVQEVARESSRLPERERRLVLGIVR